MKKFLEVIASKSFDNGLRQCNDLGKRLFINKKGRCRRFLDLGCGDGELTIEFC